MEALRRPIEYTFGATCERYNSHRNRGSDEDGIATAITIADHLDYDGLSTDHH